MSARPSLLRLHDTHAPLRETLDVLAARELRRRQLLLGSLIGIGALALAPARGLACALIPSETAGPYPGDGTNGPNVLTQSGILRSDIRSSFGASGSAVAAGTLMQLTLRLVSSSHGCAPLSGLAVYAWHCDAAGRYSMYSSGVTTQNYLRGVQVSNAAGEVHFTTIFPGCYTGRWPHIHFEVYASAEQAVNGSQALRISQLALPDASSRAVYAQTSLYPGSLSAFNGVTLNTDNVFRDDGAVLQMAALSGDNSAGYLASLEVGVNVQPTVDPNAVFADGFESS